MTLGENGPPRGVRVAPISRTIVRDMATALRERLGDTKPYVDVARLIEHRLFAEFGVVFSVRSQAALGSDEGRTYPDRLRLELRQDVYERLIAGDARARFTAMHEVGHLFLHFGVPLRSTKAELTHKHYEDSEWQSDAFAAEYLMPVTHVLRLQQKTAAAACKVFGVSMQAAIIRMNVLKSEGLLRRGG